MLLNNSCSIKADWCVLSRVWGWRDQSVCYPVCYHALLCWISVLAFHPIPDSRFFIGTFWMLWRSRRRNKVFKNCLSMTFAKLICVRILNQARIFNVWMFIRFEHLLCHCWLDGWTDGLHSSQTGSLSVTAARLRHNILKEVTHLFRLYNMK